MKKISSYFGCLSYGDYKSLIRSVVGGKNEEKDKQYIIYWSIDIFN